MITISEMPNAQLKTLESAVEKLLPWFAQFHRKFPWRADPHPYKVWLAEVMSQQTQMSTLLPYFERFLAAFPSVDALAGASEEQVMRQWSGLGYYSRARNVHAAAKAISARGDFPRTYEGWLELPGIGPYTAAAVSSQCFGAKKSVWDGNVQRVLARVFAVKKAWVPEFRREIELLLDSAIAEVEASAFNQAWMELGATVCVPKSPACSKCPISKNCAAFKMGAVGEYPAPKPRKTVIELAPRVLVSLRLRDGKYEVLLRRRESGEWFSGLWDFTTELGGVKEPVRVIEETEFARAEVFGRAKHSITHHKIALTGFARLISRAKGNSEGDWVELSIASSGEKPLATTARKLLPHLIEWTKERL